VVIPRLHVRYELGDGIAIGRKLAGAQKSAYKLSSIRNDPGEDLLFAFDWLPVELRAGLDPQLPPNFGGDRDHVLLVDRRNHGAIK